MVDVHRQTAFDRLAEVLKQFLESLPLRCTAGNSGHLLPIATFFFLVSDDLHLRSSKAIH
jgi:hypothetical protein